MSPRTKRCGFWSGGGDRVWVWRRENEKDEDERRSFLEELRESLSVRERSEK